MTQLTRRTAGALVTAAVLAVAGCSDSVTGLDNVEVTNDTDTFQLQASASGASQTLSYTWQNTGTTANINQSGTVTGGSATLTLLDDAGTQVYTRSLGETGTFVTDAGEAGSWTIRVVVSGMSGVLNFRAQKP
jgi:hypothetical protein